MHALEDPGALTRLQQRIVSAPDFPTPEIQPHQSVSELPDQ